MDLTTFIRLRAAAAILGCAVLLAGCGGGDSNKSNRADSYSNRADAYGPAGGTSAVKSRVDGAPPLGQTGEKALPESGPTYKPTGKVVADSGFRPEVNGFAFANYGNDVEPENLRPQDVERLFGNQVCIRGSGAECKLIPPAQTWMDAQNEGMAGGHCMGFSVAALRMFAGKLQPTTFGADVANDLELQGNVDLQGTIAESFVYQSVPSIAGHTFRATPAKMLDYLIKGLNEGKDLYTLGIYKADGTEGHAITPLAIEDKGGGKYVVMVYDNNYPSVTRPLNIDKNANTFDYSGATNPAEDQSPYTGDGTTNNLDLTPTLVGEGLQPCPFCSGELEAEGGGKSAAKGSVLPADERYSELTLTGDPENHPHIVLTDEEERQTGIVDGKILEEIPGVRMVKQFAVGDGGAPEPKFQIPPGKDLAISLDGSALTKRSRNNTLDFAGNGLVISIDEINIDPGQTDNVFLSGEGYGLYYEFNSKRVAETTPLLFAGVTTEDAAFTFAATAIGLKKGSTIGLLIDQEEGVVDLDASGSKGALGRQGHLRPRRRQVRRERRLHLDQRRPAAERQAQGGGGVPLQGGRQPEEVDRRHRHRAEAKGPLRQAPPRQRLAPTRPAGGPGHLETLARR